MVDVFFTFPAKLSEGAALAPFPPAKVIVVGIAALLAAAKDVRASHDAHDALVEVFELGIVA
ncbi:hypothetical protein EDB92DRAFT_1951914 [Lactarius akahatsu]|uniref:Uncharacterized protein n=1 Tax=Lactarius akahatsu TaxID=416441 RepID=A0AAD4L766_9AGAM|nr:hypothetical protein EDB92DRAFT_1951914 [Lactarius akahatsu]